MTTEVTILAHCSAEKEVRVKITDNGTTEEFTLQDGGKAKRFLYEGREISVQEVEKVRTPQDDDAVGAMS